MNSAFLASVFGSKPLGNKDILTINNSKNDLDLMKMSVRKYTWPVLGASPPVGRFPEDGFFARMWFKIKNAIDSFFFYIENMYGMTAVMRFADERRRASVIISSSIKLSFAGFDVDWMMNISSPRTFSNTSTKISPSLNRSTRASTSPTLTPRCNDIRRAIALANGRLAFPEISLGSSIVGMMSPCATRYVTDS